MARKPNDEWTTPLCSGCHLNDPGAQHKVGEAIFWDRLGINPFLLCRKLYAQRGDLVAMRAVVFVAITGGDRTPLNRPLRQPEAPLDPDVRRLVEGIALTLAQEHHAMENAGKPLSTAPRSRFDHGCFDRPLKQEEK